jgi:hypothetical protein
MKRHPGIHASPVLSGRPDGQVDPPSSEPARLGMRNKRFCSDPGLPNVDCVPAFRVDLHPVARHLPLNGRRARATAILQIDRLQRCKRPGFLENMLPGDCVGKVSGHDPLLSFVIRTSNGYQTILKCATAAAGCRSALLPKLTRISVKIPSRLRHGCAACRPGRTLPRCWPARRAWVYRSRCRDWSATRSGGGSRSS